MTSSISGGLGRPGFEPGRTKKPEDSQSVQKPFSVEEAGKTHSSIAAAVSTEATEPLQKVKKAEKESALEKKATIVRKMSNEDVVDLLIKFQKMPTKENQRLVMVMLQHGVEISADHLDMLQRLIKGDKKKNSLESAIVSLMKGLGDTPKSADVVMRYLQHNQQLSSVFQQLMQSIQDIQSAMIMMKSYFEPGFLQAVTSMFSDLQKELKRYLDDHSKEPMSRHLIVKDLKAVSDFLGGVLQRFNGMDEANVLHFIQLARGLNQHISSVLEQFTSQMVLSKDNEMSAALSDRFHYWQIPNPFVQSPFPIDILIQKEGGKTTPIDPDRSNVKLKFHTEDLGEVFAELKVEDRQVYTVFKTEFQSTQALLSENMIDLNSRLAAINYQLRSLKSVQKKVDVKQFLIPKARLTEISRVSSEV